MDIHETRANRQEGFFDGYNDEKLNLWAIVQRFLCNNSNASSKSLIELYARDFKRQTVIETISKNFTHGKPLGVFDSNKIEQQCKDYMSEFILNKRSPKKEVKILNKEDHFKRQQEELQQQAEIEKKKAESKARFMQDKEKDKLGRANRYQIKSVKKSVKQNQMTPETGNQLILKQVQQTNTQMIQSLNNVMDGSTKKLMQIIYQEHCSKDKHFEQMTKLNGFSNWLYTNTADNDRASRPGTS